MTWPFPEHVTNTKPYYLAFPRARHILNRMTCPFVVHVTHTKPYNFALPRARHCHVACLSTGLQPLPKRILQIGLSTAFSFNSQYLLVALDLSISCLHLLPHLSLSSLSFNNLFITQDVISTVSLPFVIVFSILIFSLSLNTISHRIDQIDLIHHPATHFKTSQVFLICFYSVIKCALFLNKAHFMSASELSTVYHLM